MANLLRIGDRKGASVPPSNTRATTALPVLRSAKKGSNTPFKPWDSAPFWIESIAREEATRKQWEQMYGWMADLDAKGNLQPRENTFVDSSPFSNKIPNSRGHDYGWHLQSPLGREIKMLQARFNNQHRKHRSADVLGFD